MIVFFPTETAIASPRAPTANRPRIPSVDMGAVFGHQKCTKTVVGSQKYILTYIINVFVVLIVF